MGPPCFSPVGRAFKRVSEFGASPAGILLTPHTEDVVAAVYLLNGYPAAWTNLAHIFLLFHPTKHGGIFVSATFVAVKPVVTLAADLQNRYKSFLSYSNFLFKYSFCLRKCALKRFLKLKVKRFYNEFKKWNK